MKSSSCIVQGLNSGLVVEGSLLESVPDHDSSLPCRLLHFILIIICTSHQPEMTVEGTVKLKFISG